jgi:hypothetical protein
MATQKVLTTLGTPLVFKNTGGDAVWIPADTALALGRQSAVLDLTALHALRYEWRCTVQWVATPAAGDQFRIYLVTSSASATAALTDGGSTFGDAEVAAATEVLYQANTKLIGIVTATAADVIFCASGIIEIGARYVGVCGYNGSATKAMHATDATFHFTLTPLIDDVQAAA